MLWLFGYVASFCSGIATKLPVMWCLWSNKSETLVVTKPLGNKKNRMQTNLKQRSVTQQSSYWTQNPKGQNKSTCLMSSPLRIILDRQASVRERAIWRSTKNILDILTLSSSHEYLGIKYGGDLHCWIGDSVFPFLTDIFMHRKKIQPQRTDPLSYSQVSSCILQL